jgi:broad specificity phosphatase PhoE
MSHEICVAAHTQQAEELRQRRRADEARSGRGPPAWVEPLHHHAREEEEEDQEERQWRPADCHAPIIVHFLRHGEAVHNALGAAAGPGCCRCKRAAPHERDTPQDDCPYNSVEAEDAPLTGVGKAQAAAAAPRLAAAIVSASAGREPACVGGAAGGLATAAAAPPLLLVTSPLQRATQTALIATATCSAAGAAAATAAGDEAAAPPIAAVALQCLAEQQGMHRCDRCRPVSAIAAQFGSRLNVDDLLDATRAATAAAGSSQRESKDSVADRAEVFLRWLAAQQQQQQQKQQQVVVASHHHFLLVLFGAVLGCDAAELGGHEIRELRRPFRTGELRSVRLHISRTPSRVR